MGRKSKAKSKVISSNEEPTERQEQSAQPSAQMKPEIQLSLVAVLDNLKRQNNAILRSIRQDSNDVEFLYCLTSSCLNSLASQFCHVGINMRDILKKSEGFNQYLFAYKWKELFDACKLSKFNMSEYKLKSPIFFAIRKILKENQRSLKAADKLKEYFKPNMKEAYTLFLERKISDARKNTVAKLDSLSNHPDRAEDFIELLHWLNDEVRVDIIECALNNGNIIEVDENMFQDIELSPNVKDLPHIVSKIHMDELSEELENNSGPINIILTKRASDIKALEETLKDKSESTAKNSPSQSSQNVDTKREIEVKPRGASQPSMEGTSTENQTNQISLTVNSDGKFDFNFPSGQNVKLIRVTPIVPKRNDEIWKNLGDVQEESHTIDPFEASNDALDEVTNLMEDLTLEDQIDRFLRFSETDTEENLPKDSTEDVEKAPSELSVRERADLFFKEKMLKSKETADNKHSIIETREGNELVKYNEPTNDGGKKKDSLINQDSNAAKEVESINSSTPKKTKIKKQKKVALSSTQIVLKKQMPVKDEKNTASASHKAEKGAKARKASGELIKWSEEKQVMDPKTSRMDMMISANSTISSYDNVNLDEITPSIENDQLISVEDYELSGDESTIHDIEGRCKCLECKWKGKRSVVYTKIDAIPLFDYTISETRSQIDITVKVPDLLRHTFKTVHFHRRESGFILEIRNVGGCVYVFQIEQLYRQVVPSKCYYKFMNSTTLYIYLAKKRYGLWKYLHFFIPTLKMDWTSEMRRMLAGMPGDMHNVKILDFVWEKSLMMENGLASNLRLPLITNEFPLSKYESEYILQIPPTCYNR